MKKNKDDLLDDIEGFVDSDWKEVYENFKQEEYKKEISEASIPDYPYYRDFYNSLLEIGFNDLRSLSPRIAELIHFITRDRSEQSLKNVDIFEHLWEILCDRRGLHKIHRITCSHCNKENVILYRRKPINPRVMWELREYDTVNERMTSEIVCCINCGYVIYNVVGGKLIGVFSRRIYEQQSGDNF